jgi:hypothetical protein
VKDFHSRGCPTVVVGWACLSETMAWECQLLRYGRLRYAFPVVMEDVAWEASGTIITVLEDSEGITGVSKGTMVGSEDTMVITDQ